MFLLSNVDRKTDEPGAPQNVFQALSYYPPGVIAVPASHVGRYREFDICLSCLMSPPRSKIVWRTGLNVAKNMNDIIREMFSNCLDAQWLWILGDDHTFDSGLLMRLLSHDVDVVVPTVLHREPPYLPVLYGPAPEYKIVNPSWFDNKTGLQDISGLTVGSAGMLIKRSTLEKVPEPWFEVGRTHPEVGGSDLYFCNKLNQLGIKMYMDMYAAMGHITHVAVWPAKNKKGKLMADIRMAEDFSPGPATIGDCQE